MVRKRNLNLRLRKRVRSSFTVTHTAGYKKIIRNSPGEMGATANPTNKNVQILLIYFVAHQNPQDRILKLFKLYLLQYPPVE